MRDSLFVPLGKLPTQILFELSSEGYLEKSQVLDGIPHPSGANAERIAYFLGDKKAEDCSEKTNTLKIDQAKKNLVAKLGFDNFISKLLPLH